MTQMLTDRYHERLAGTLSCYDPYLYTQLIEHVSPIS
jgi:hypothetical protein